MRLPRFLEKKRGERRTGSQIWGSVGEAAFYACLLLAGIVFGSLLITGVAVPEWRINHDYLSARAVVVGKGLQRRLVSDPPHISHSVWAPVLRVNYPVNQRSIESWSQPSSTSVTSDRKTALDRLKDLPSIGATISCWYDPDSPMTVVLGRGYNWWMWLLMLLLPGALVAFGGSGLHKTVRSWGKSDEHKAAAVKSSDPAVSMGQIPLEAPGFPSIPACDNLVNSPGTILRYRLPIESSESWALLGFGLFSIVWNAVLLVLAIGAGLDLMGGRVDWLLFALIVPFAVVGVGSVVLFFRRLVLTTSVGPTQVEVSDHPLRPGQQYDILLAQGGSGILHSLEISMELEEQATYRQGTDTRTERVVVSRHMIKQWQDVRLSPVSRFETETKVQVPIDAMHSFESEHNVVSWRFVVRGVPDRWPPFCRVFPLIIFPRDDRHHQTPHYKTQNQKKQDS